MRRTVLELAVILLVTVSLQAQTAQEIITKYIKAIGGLEKIHAVKTLHRSGKFTGGGGFEAAIVQENKRPSMVRREFSLQGLTGITAYDGKTGWKIEPWGGKKDPEPLSEEEMRQIIQDSDFDGPLIDYNKKGHKVEYVGMEPVEGTDALKLKVTLADGDVLYYYMDTDYYVPIKINIKRVIRGEEQEFETTLGDYKEIEGWYLPYSVEFNMKGSQDKSVVAYDTIKVNLSLDDSRFEKPAAGPNIQNGKK